MLGSESKQHVQIKHSSEISSISLCLVQDYLTVVSSVLCKNHNV